MSEPKNIKICKKFKKIAGLLAEKINEFGVDIDTRTVIETSGDEPSTWLDEPEIHVAHYMADTFKVNYHAACAIMEMANFMKEQYDKENIGESTPR